MQYDVDFAKFQDEMDQHLESGDQPDVRKLDRHAKEAEQALREIEMEARNVPPDERRPLENKLAELRAGLRERCRAVEAAKESVELRALLGASGSTVGRPMQEIGAEMMSDLRQRQDVLPQSRGGVAEAGRSQGACCCAVIASVLLVSCSAAFFMMGNRAGSHSGAGSSDGPSDAGSNVFPADHCSYDTGAWPRFDSEHKLRNDEHWSAYFTAVYGGVPSSGYPICTGAFQFVWRVAGANAGVVETPTQCSNKENPAGQELPDGSYYTGFANWEARDAFGYIANSKLLGQAVPAGKWVEVTHTVFEGDAGATWFYMSVGSGVWHNVGKTVVFEDHPDAVRALLGSSCHKGPEELGLNPTSTECFDDYPALYAAARSQGYDSIQFTGHNDCTCGPTGASSFIYNRACMTEIVDLTDSNGAENACGRGHRGGWEAISDCKCQESLKSLTQDGLNVGYSNCGAS